MRKCQNHYAHRKRQLPTQLLDKKESKEAENTLLGSKTHELTMHRYENEFIDCASDVEGFFKVDNITSIFITGPDNTVCQNVQTNVWTYR